MAKWIADHATADRRAHNAVVVLGTIAILVMAAGYFTDYRSLVFVDHILLPSGLVPASGSGVAASPCRIVYYEHVPGDWQAFCRIVFAPAEWVDERLRPDVWKP